MAVNRSRGAKLMLNYTVQLLYLDALVNYLCKRICCLHVARKRYIHGVYVGNNYKAAVVLRSASWRLFRAWNHLIPIIFPKHSSGLVCLSYLSIFTFRLVFTAMMTSWIPLQSHFSRLFYVVIHNGVMNRQGSRTKDGISWFMTSWGEENRRKKFRNRKKGGISRVFMRFSARCDDVSRKLALVKLRRS